MHKIRNDDRKIDMQDKILEPRLYPTCETCRFHESFYGKPDECTNVHCDEYGNETAGIPECISHRERNPEGESCKKCKFYHIYNFGGVPDMCRRYPPRESDKVIYGDGWCGEFKKKEKTNENIRRNP